MNNPLTFYALMRYDWTIPFLVQRLKFWGYEIVRRDRNRNGGDVASYLRNNIPYVERSDLIPENVEALCLEIRKPKSKPVLLSTWYRPPDSNIELLECFENFLKKTDDENKEIIITGDFNCDMLKKD